MVGPVDRADDVNKALKLYILKEREKEKQEDEAEAEKTRKKKEEDDKKLKVETESKAVKDKIVELTKKCEHLKQEKNRVFEYLKKLVFENPKYRLEVEDIAKLYEIGLAVPTHVGTVQAHQSVHASSRVPSPIITRTPAVSVSNQYKTSATTVMPVQAMPAPKRNRSPSPVYRPPYAYKQAAGPHAFQKLEDPHRNHEYNRSYLYPPKPGNAPPTSNYSAFYPPAQNTPYSHPSQQMHGGAPAGYSTYNTNRDNVVDSLHKSQSPTGPPSSAPPQHSSLYAHRSPAPSGPHQSMQSNHVYHPKDRGPYPEEKYYMVRPGSHIPVHGVLSIQQPPQGAKHGSITSGYPVRPVATQMNPQSQLHIQPPHGHHPSSSGHHVSLSSHHSAPSHQQHHPSSGVHYPPSHHVTQVSQSSHSSQQPPSSGPPHHAPSHHQSHMQQMHVQSHHPPPNSHHQMMSHHSSQSMHHSSALHHPSHHPSSMHHQPHIQHISQHSAPSQHQPGQQSQPTSVVTSQAYANQLSAIQAGGRVVYSQPPH